MTLEPNGVSGVLLLDKPPGMTSHDAVQRVRRAFGQRSVGHSGTLDPMASGLLVLGIGNATRLLRFVESSDKRYIGRICLGVATDTLDADGRVTMMADPTHVRRVDVEGAVASLVGARNQAVPAYSAVQVGGVRLYKKARRGEVFARPERPICVHSLTVTGFHPWDIEVEAVVSKGTYMRVLAEEIGARLGVPAHLAMLRRVEVGQYRIQDAKALEAVAGVPGELVSMDDSVAHLPAIDVAGRAIDDVRHGRRLSAAVVAECARQRLAPGDTVRVIGRRLLAVGVVRDDGSLNYECVLASPSDDANGLKTCVGRCVRD